MPNFAPNFIHFFISMIWCTIIVLIIFAGVIIFLLKSNEPKPKLPNSIFERIGVAAVSIQQYLNDKGYTNTKNDRSIWNISSFIIAFLIELKICSVSDRIHLQLEFQKYYEDEDERFACKLWIDEGVSFYRNQINDMLSEKHSLPDVIVYNLLHPDVDKKSFEDLSLFDVDMIATMDCWAYIHSTMDKFFFSDPGIAKLPRGC